MVRPVEAAFQAHRAQGRLEGQPRSARRYTTDPHCPWPTPEDRLWCLLVYLKTSPRQGVQGRRCAMGQSQAQQGSHLLWVVLRATRRPLGDTPTRSVPELAQRLGVAEAEATAVVDPRQEPSPPGAPPAAPLWATMAPHGASRVPRSRLRRRAVIAARRQAPRCHMGCGSRRRSPSAFGVRPRRGALRRSGGPRPRRLPGPQAAGCSRTWAAWRSPGTTGPPAGRPATREDGP